MKLTGIGDPGYRGNESCMQRRGDRPFFECSAQPIVSLPTNELNRRGFLAFWVDSATVKTSFSE